MGRPTVGWRLRERPGYPFSVRFTVNGKRYSLGTGETDRERAAVVAAELYANAVRGERRQPRRSPSRGAPLTEVASQWLTSVASMLDPETRATYALYAETHWAPRWATVEAITSASLADYARTRMRVVRASTVRKELSAMRRMLAWCEEQGLLAETPPVPSIPKRALGAAHKQGRKGPPVELTPAEVKKLTAQIPETHRGYPTRARFVVAYETGLRPATLEALSVPEHWRPGARELHISPELDKARAERPLPLTVAARKALASAAPKAGPIFPPRDCRGLITSAAVRALGEERGRRFSAYYFRHNRLTHWAETSDNLAGIQYLAGHKHVSTTARYVKASKRAALEVLGTRARRARKTKPTR